MAEQIPFGRSVKVRVPGTSANLGPGFDCMGIACTIYNELELELLPDERLEISAAGDGADRIPTDNTNMVWRAIDLFLHRAGVDRQYRGARFHMKNNVPLSRGLGSSATAIVAGLRAANAFLGDPLDRKSLLALATEMEGHPDNVAPAIYGGFTVSVTDGNAPRCLSFVPSIPLKMVVAIPSFFLSTRLARSVLPDNVPRADAVFNVGRAAMLAAAMARGKVDYLAAALQDRLHQPYREELIPGFAAVTAAARSAGAIGTVLSGAGPAIIAFTLAHEAAIGDAMIGAFARHDVEARAVVLGIDRTGAKVIE